MDSGRKVIRRGRHVGGGRRPAQYAHRGHLGAGRTSLKRILQGAVIIKVFGAKVQRKLCVQYCSLTVRVTRSVELVCGSQIIAVDGVRTLATVDVIYTVDGVVYVQALWTARRTRAEGVITAVGIVYVAIDDIVATVVMDGIVARTSVEDVVAVAGARGRGVCVGTVTVQCIVTIVAVEGIVSQPAV